MNRSKWGIDTEDDMVRTRIIIVLVMLVLGLPLAVWLGMCERADQDRIKLQSEAKP